MTRLASILGVATVATLVLLSGCEAAVKTDYTAKLDGTWTKTGLMITAPNPDMTQGAPPTIQIPTDVTVVIVDGSGVVNTGTFELTVSQTVALPPAPKEVSTGTGTVTAESSSVLKVTLTDIMGPADPDTVTALKDVEQSFGYNLMGDSLKVSSAVLAALRITASATEELELTKQMASTSSR